MYIFLAMHSKKEKLTDIENFLMTNDLQALFASMLNAYLSRNALQKKETLMQALFASILNAYLSRNALQKS